MYCYRLISTVVRMCNSSSLVTSTTCIIVRFLHVSFSFLSHPFPLLRTEFTMSVLFCFTLCSLATVIPLGCNTHCVLLLLVLYTLSAVTAEVTTSVMSVFLVVFVVTFF